MGIIKIKKNLAKELSLKENSIHDPSFLCLSKPEKTIPKETEIELHIRSKTITIHWQEYEKEMKHSIPKSFINILNKYLEKPLSIR